MNSNKYFILCFVIAWLNLFDGILTDYGLLHHYIEELNPIMLYLWENNRLHFLFTKVALSSLVLLVGLWSIHYRSFKKLNLVKTGINIAFILYIYVSIVHLFWVFSVLTII